MNGTEPDDGGNESGTTPAAEVVETLEERLETVAEEKQERIEREDHEGMAYRAGKEMGLIFAIETVEEWFPEVDTTL